MSKSKSPMTNTRLPDGQEIPNTTNKTVISPNLLSPDAKEELTYQKIGHTIKKIILVLSTFLALFWLVGGILLWRINQEEKEIALKLENDIDASKLAELNKMNDQFKDSRTLNTKVDKSLQKEYRFSGPLEELSRIAPQGVALTDFETNITQPGWIKIKGVAQNRNGFLLFKKGLEESQFYSKVDSPLSNYVSSENLEFELNAQLKNWSPSWAEALMKKPSNPVDAMDSGNSSADTKE